MKEVSSCYTWTIQRGGDEASDRRMGVGGKTKMNALDRVYAFCIAPLGLQYTSTGRKLGRAIRRFNECVVWGT